MNNEQLINQLGSIPGFNLCKFDTPIGEFIKVETPFLYSDRDFVSVFLKGKPNEFLITDLGESARRLSLSLSLGQQKLYRIRNFIKAKGISKDRDTLYVLKHENIAPFPTLSDFALTIAIIDCIYGS